VNCVNITGQNLRVKYSVQNVNVNRVSKFKPLRFVEFSARRPLIWVPFQNALHVLFYCTLYTDFPCGSTDAAVARHVSYAQIACLYCMTTMQVLWWKLSVNKTTRYRLARSRRQRSINIDLQNNANALLMSSHNITKTRRGHTCDFERPQTRSSHEILYFFLGSAYTKTSEKW